MMIRRLVVAVLMAVTALPLARANMMMSPTPAADSGVSMPVYQNSPVDTVMPVDVPPADPGMPPAPAPQMNNPFGMYSKDELLDAWNRRLAANKTHEDLIKSIDADIARLQQEIAAKNMELAAATTDANRKFISDQIASRMKFLAEYQADRKRNVDAIAENLREIMLIKAAYQKFADPIPLVDPRPERRP